MPVAIETYKSEIFSEKCFTSFEEFVFEAYKLQYCNNHAYKTYCDYLRRTPKNVHNIENIPFLPVSFFKQNEIVCGKGKRTTLFKSSGTSGLNSYHKVLDLDLYDKNLLEGFRYFYGEPAEYRFIALLPGYLSRGDASLVYMLNRLTDAGKHIESGLYSYGNKDLVNKIEQLESEGKPYFLIGVSHALNSFAKDFSIPLKHGIVMETGGMKGMLKEIIRTEMHSFLRKAFSVEAIHSEYGMTELLSQAYAKADGIFRTTPRMKVLIREVTDPFSISVSGNGGLNIIDLANIHSCCFIETSDLGSVNPDGSFELLGRFDNSDVRGCNQMV